jgi:release factor glutamine methyltransferase
VNAADPTGAASVDTVRRLVAEVATTVHSESEAKWIVAQAAGFPLATLLTALDAPVAPETIVASATMAERRRAGVPLQYVLGTWAFRQLEVTVDARALIPRPETEQVVEVALEELGRLSRAAVPSPSGRLVAADLGTGSGVIALSLALEGAAPDIEVWATDASPVALELARTNLARLTSCSPAAGARVRVAEGSWFAALPGTLAGHVHLVVSNPPYVSAAEWSVLDPEIRLHEPREALVPGDTGREALEILIDQARRWLVPGGSLVLELAPHQATALSSTAVRAGYLPVDVRTDLAGRQRTLVARWPGA